MIIDTAASMVTGCMLLNLDLMQIKLITVSYTETLTMAKYRNQLIEKESFVSKL